MKEAILCCDDDDDRGVAAGRATGSSRPSLLVIGKDPAPKLLKELLTVVLAAVAAVLELVSGMGKAPDPRLLVLVMELVLVADGGGGGCCCTGVC